MRIGEIREQLKSEFPGKYVAIGLDVLSHTSGNTDAELTIYTHETGHIHCTSVEDGIRRLKERLSPETFVNSLDDLDVGA